MNPQPKIPKLHSLYLRAFRPPFKYLFVFAHMRSGSTLLVHLLNSSPQIIGYGETKTVYTNEDSFCNLLSKVSLFFEKNRLSETYVMDKIVQDELFSQPELLNREDVRCIFLVRDAIQSLPSITDMYVNVFPKYHENWSGGENEALEYYKTRLSKLVDLAQQKHNGKKPIVITYDDIVKRPGELFSLFHENLEVENTFSDYYSLHKATGEPVIGDFSETIRSGKIQKEKRQVDMIVSPRLIEEGEQFYQQKLCELRQCCDSI